jgi:predicted nuclease of predicted toxin-antitoxin system
MRFLVDECTGPTVARWLGAQGHDVFSVYDDDRGARDTEILARAVREDRILITNDKDFGEHVFRDRQPHRGVVLLRLDDNRTASKIAAVERLLADFAGQLSGRFTVVTDRSIRLISPPAADSPDPGGKNPDSAS